MAEKEIIYAAPDLIESPCEDACPVSLKCHSYVSLIERGEFEKAFRAIRQRLPFPMTLGRICDRPCEKECRRAIVDEPVAIRELKRFVADTAFAQDYDYRPTIKANRKEKTAVVGSGPAGLAAAYDLAREGFKVTVFEALPVAGGMMAVGCPEYKLPKAILSREIENITALGVEIKLDSRVKDVDSLLKQGYSAVFLAIGTHQGMKLPVPGADAKSVLTGVSFLRDVNLGKQVDLGKSVVVVGGGGVAFDCARAAVRLGAAEVHLVCVEPRDGMRVRPEEVTSAEEEGVTVHPACTVARVQVEGGRAAGVECLTVSEMSFDAEGRLRLSTVPGSEQVIKADTVILAVGQTPDTDAHFLSGLEVNAQGFLVVNSETLATSTPGVFAGGDAVDNSGSVIKSIASGQKAARSIIAYLNGSPVPGKRADDELIAFPGKPFPESVVAARPTRVLAESVPACQRRASFVDIAAACTPDEARAEASRCLRCDTVATGLAVQFFGDEKRDADEQAAAIKQEGMGLTAGVMRRALLGGLDLRPKPAPRKAESVIFTGCYVWGTPQPLIALCQILKRFNEPYGFLSHEECCGAPMIVQAKAAGSDAEVQKVEGYVRDFATTNLKNAAAMGAKDIYYMCAWCTYKIMSIPQGKQGIGCHYYLDLLVRLVQERRPSLKLERKVAYFAGGRHRKHLYLSGAEDIDWGSYRVLLNGIKGLEVVDLAPYCCVTYPDITLKTMEKEKLDTLVTPCITCYGRLMRKAPPGVRVITPAELMLEALG